jgi:tetratricopeptide (TPR) repeat protein
MTLDRLLRAVPGKSWHPSRIVIIITLILALLPEFAVAQDPHFARGLELQNAGKLEEAIAEYELSLKAGPQFPVLANLGSIYARMGRFSEAVERYEEALKLAPGQPLVKLNLGLAHYKMGDLQKATPLFADVLQTDPANLQARTLLADSHFQQGNSSKVIELLESHAEKDPNNLSIAYLLGMAFIREKRAEKGGQLIDRIFRRGEPAVAHLMLGTARAEIFDNKGAIEEFEKAIQLNPNLPLAHSSLGKALLQSGDSERPIQEFEAELKINPHDFTANLYSGLLRRRMDLTEEALPFLIKALQLRPDDASAQFEVALIDVHRREWDSAQEKLEQIVKRYPGFIDAHVNLAKVYYRKKMKAEGDRQQDIIERLRMEQQKQQPGSKVSETVPTHP